MKFQVYPTSTNGSHASWNTEEYDDASTANARCKFLNDELARVEGAVRFKVRRKVEDAVDADDWHKRERDRFESGEYKPVPWDTSLLPYHYAHVSKADHGMIAFTENDAKGRANIKTRMLPGRYLQKYYRTVFNETQIRQYAARVCIENDMPVFGITKDADEIVSIYVNGPRSCMSKDEKSFFNGYHPARIYAAGDLGLAWLKGQHSDTYSCRSLCWPDKKVYGRVYGDGASWSLHLERELHKMGYYQDTSGFNGAKLHFVKHPTLKDCVVAPYVDPIPHGRLAIIDGKKFIILDERGRHFTLRRTDGLAQSNLSHCVSCDAAFIYDPIRVDGGWVDDTRTQCRYYCSDCAPKVSDRCARCGGRHKKSNTLKHGDKNYCGPCFNVSFATCYKCNQMHNRKEGVSVERKFICNPCRGNIPVISCNGCNIEVLQSDTTKHGRWLYCGGCYDKIQRQQFTKAALSINGIRKPREAVRNPEPEATARQQRGGPDLIEIPIERDG